MSEQHIHGRACETHCPVKPDYPEMKHKCSEVHPSETFPTKATDEGLQRDLVRCGRLPGHGGEHHGFGAGMARIRW